MKKHRLKQLSINKRNDIIERGWKAQAYFVESAAKMTQREYSNPIDLPFSSEETQRDDADSRSTVLMPGNLEVMTPEVAERIPSDGHR